MSRSHSLATTTASTGARLTAAGGAAIAGLAFAALPAEAQTTRHIPFSFAVQDTITDWCPFPIEVSGTSSGHVLDVRDDAGNIVRVVIHYRNSFTLTANGTTLVERDRFVERDLDFASTGGGAPGLVIATGLITNIRVPHGRSVVVEAGRITDNLVTGEVTLRGRFSVSEGDTAALCAAFTAG